MALLALTTGFVGGAASCARRTRWAMTSAIRASMGIAFPWGARSGTLPHLTSRSREDVTRQFGIVWVDKLAVRHPDECWSQWRNFARDAEAAVKRLLEPPFRA